MIDEIPPPVERVPGYPAPVAAVLMRALERRVSTRWENAGAMRDALLEAMRAQGWSVGPETLAQLVAFALDGQSIEDRWERIASGVIPSPGEEVETLVTDADAAPIPLRPMSFAPPSAPVTDAANAIDAADAADATDTWALGAASLGPNAPEPSHDAYALGSLAPVSAEAPPPPPTPRPPGCRAAAWCSASWPSRAGSPRAR
ncbi:MAG: hypothetical protein U0325_32275 [Polyangiales bacterium]